MHTCTDPPQALPAEVFPGSSCFPSQSLPPWDGLNSVLGKVSVQAAEAWHGKANPSDTEAVTSDRSGGGQYPPIGELQHPPVCAAWLHFFLFALVPNTHLPREVCLDHPQFRLRCQSPAIQDLPQALITDASWLSPLSAAAPGAGRWRVAKGKPWLPECKSLPRPG